MDEQKGRENNVPVDGMGITESAQIEEPLEQEGETPLVILKPGPILWQIATITVIASLLFFILWVLLPVFNAGSFAAIEEGHGIVQKIGLFCMALYGVPFGAFFLLVILLKKTGDYNFFDDRLEFKSFGGREVIIPYNRMYVLRRRNRRLEVIISTEDRRQGPSIRLSPLQRFKHWYDDITIGSLSREEIWSGIDQSKSAFRVWDNYADIPVALRILREKAFSFKEE